MSLNKQGCSCARCKAYLFSEDDVVYCPVCGAPHHRECYNAIGHCALEDFHGTSEEYSNKTEEHENSEKSEKTKNTNSNYSSQNFSFGFDFFGGVPNDYKLDENVTADDAKKFVIANTHRYIPKFAILNKKNKVSWNWAAFLFPCGWTLSRKMYKNGIISGLLLLASSMLAYPLNQAVYNLNFDEISGYSELFSKIYEMLPGINIAVIIFALLGVILELGIRIFSALFADYSYKGYTISSIKKIKEESDDIEFDYRKKGGINIFLLLFGEMALQFLGNLIINFI